MKTIAAALLGALLATAGSAGAAELTSISKITFGPSDTLFAADWRAGSVHAIRLPAARTAGGAPFNIMDLSTPLADALGTAQFRIESIAMRPGTDEAYVALAVGKDLKPALAVATPDGKAQIVDLGPLVETSQKLDGAGGSLTFWRSIPESAFTVTDMKWHRGKLYVAGLANQRFSSTLRVLAYPFGAHAMTSVEMYHTAHGQWETRAPIRAMTFATLGGKDTLLAAYLCSPLVAIPVTALANGAHVKATSLSELGIAGIPEDMFTYDAHSMDGKQTFPMVFVNERYRAALAFPVAAAAARDAAGGMTKPVDMMRPPAPGSEVAAQTLPLSGVTRVADQNDRFVVAVRRDLETGAAQLVSYDKSVFFRLSDFQVSEYLFPDYAYPAGMQQQMILPFQNLLKKEEGYPELVRGAQPRPRT